MSTPTILTPTPVDENPFPASSDPIEHSVENAPIPAVEPAPAPPASVGDIVRLVIAALVAAINTHCNSTGKDLAAQKTADLHAALESHRQEKGTADNAVANPDDPVTLDEQDHLDKILAHIQNGPAPINAFPVPPAVILPPEPVEPVSETPVESEPTPQPVAA